MQQLQRVNTSPARTSEGGTEFGAKSFQTVASVYNDQQAQNEPISNRTVFNALLSSVVAVLLLCFLAAASVSGTPSSVGLPLGRLRYIASLLEDLAIR